MDNIQQTLASERLGSAQCALDDTGMSFSDSLCGCYLLRYDLIRYFDLYIKS